MAYTDNSKPLEKLLNAQIDEATQSWLKDKIHNIVTEKSVKNIYLTYSLLARKVGDKKISLKGSSSLESYLALQEATILAIARIYFLKELLDKDHDFFAPKVKKIITLADSIELETFLKYLILLPHPEDYSSVAVDALRTNIASVFDALALHNPYPAKYFDDKQWNQMYLKAAFMQRPLDKIANIDARANADLARIISDYAHERWAAGRDIDPYFWRPIPPFMNDALLEDMEHLFHSDDPIRQKTAAICCAASASAKAKQLLKKHPDLEQKTATDQLNWNTLYD